MFCLLNFTCLTDLRFLIYLTVCYDLTGTYAAGRGAAGGRRCCSLRNTSPVKLAADTAAGCVTRTRSNRMLMLQLPAQHEPGRTGG